MKKILLSSAILVGAVGLGLAATIAFFQDSESSSGNTLGAGVINLRIGNTSYYHGELMPDTTWDMTDDLSIHNFLNFTDLKPGDWGEDTVAIDVGSNDAFACAHVNITQNLDNGINNPEDEFDGIINQSDGTPDGDLAGELQFVLWADDGDNVLETGETQIAQGLASAFLDGETFALADSAVNHFRTGAGLSGGATYYIGKAWCYGTIGLAPLDQDGVGTARTPAGAITNTGITCNGAPVTNLSQTDRLVGDISFYAEQVSSNTDFVCSDELFVAMPPSIVISNLENKSGGNIVVDSTYGTLQYDPIAPTFNYDFVGYGMAPSTTYSLIYYGDGWPGNHPGALIAQGSSDASGIIILNGSVDLGINLPEIPDTNYGVGAKVWLVPSTDYDPVTKSLIAYHETQYLFDKTDADWVNYTRPTTSTIFINTLGGDVASQYGYNHDYSTANVSFNYTTAGDDRIGGTLTATGLKPYATYQVKFSGTPTCLDAGGDDLINEYIGLKGRWTCTDCGGTALSRNRTDAEYYAYSYYRGDSSECIAGYLVWDQFTADSSGNATAVLSTDDSFHVLFCGGGTCNSNVNTDLAYLDPAHPTVAFCPAASVNGQIERGTCGGLSLSAGSYDLTMSLTEESFHQGNWATVLTGPIGFTIY